MTQKNTYDKRKLQHSKCISLGIRLQFLNMRVQHKHACVKVEKKYTNMIITVWQDLEGFPPPHSYQSFCNWLNYFAIYKFEKKNLRPPSQKPCGFAHSAHKPACIVFNCQLDRQLSFSNCSNSADTPASNSQPFLHNSCPSKHWVLLSPTSVFIC